MKGEIFSCWEETNKRGIVCVMGSLNYIGENRDVRKGVG